ncbi:MAG: enoyl-CoA hydratase/isomerase family protein [Solirubrobacterales bacterium]
MSAEVRLEEEGAVAILTLDNGPLNLLTRGLRAQLQSYAEQLAARPTEVRAVVVRGGERAFSAGSDIREFPADAAVGLELARGEHACCRAVASMPQPTIAALEGHALGGGLELAVSCDLRVAAADASLGMPEVRLGVYPGECAQTLQRLVGPARAKQLMLTGAPIDASRAERIGLVDELVPAGQAADAALALAQAIAAHPGLAVRAIKAAVDEESHERIRECRPRHEQTMSEMFGSHDAQEGVRAFLDRREPAFRHH